MIRSVLRVASASLARPVAMRRVMARAAFGVAAISTAGAATTSTSTPTTTGSVAATNTRSRDVAHVTSTTTATTSAATTPKAKHWSADEYGINAEQRLLAKVQSSDAVERLAAATTRELLQSACTAPGVIEAKLTHEVVASAVSRASADEEETLFLANMEKEFGRDVLQVLRRQEWNVNVAATASTKDQTTTLVCYFQEGTQRILYRRLSAAV